MNKTSIEWTENTWNPITGCTHISSGCDNCYARTMAKRLKAMGNVRYRNEFKITVHKDLFDIPLRKKKPQIIFVCSMSDMFHESISYEIIDELFEVMAKAHWHIFQILTKRSERLLEYSHRRSIPKNVWLGVTVENTAVKNRVNDLRKVSASVKFVSCEPLLGSLADVDFNGIDWLIAGGESGPKSRPLNEDWIIELREKCVETDTLFFFKQWGGKNKKKNGNVLQGKTYREMPEYKLHDSI